MSTSRLCAAFPWPEMVVFGLLALALGIVIGFAWGRASKSPNGGLMSAQLTRLRVTYNEWAPIAVVVIGALAALGIILSAVATITNVRQDAEHAAEAAQRAAENEARDKQTAVLLKCFDQYAQAQSASSSAVRDASVEVDEATGIRDDALSAEGVAFGRLVQRILAHTVTDDDVRNLADTLQVRARTSRALDRAQDELDKARQENPVPPAPSKFCDTKPAK